MILKFKSQINLIGACTKNEIETDLQTNLNWNIINIRLQQNQTTVTTDIKLRLNLLKNCI